MSTFSRDLKRGKKFEEKHLAIIQKTYPDAYMIDGYCKEWDIYIPSEKFGIEVKSDKMSQQTGNIVVEIKFNGKPSALSTTKAKYWIFDTGVDTIQLLPKLTRGITSFFFYFYLSILKPLHLYNGSEAIYYE